MEETAKSRSRNFPVKNDFYSRTNSVDAYNTVDVLPNPDPVLKQVNNTWANYQEILWDPHLTAVIASRKSVTLSKKWFIEKDGAPARVVKFIEKAFKMFDVHRATEEILDSVLYGMQPMEPIWQRPKKFEGENKIFCVEFIGRPAWWFQYDRDNILRFRSKANPWPGDEIRPYSLINPRNNPKYDNPYGEALLSKVYWSVNFKKGGFKYWVEGAERYGLPLLEGSPPRGAGEPEYDKLFDKLKKIAKGTIIITPADAKITVHDLKTKGTGEMYKALVDFANAEISKAILGQTLTTEAGDKGARALGQVHDNVRHDLAESDEIKCEGSFDQLIRWMVDLNFGETVIAPKFKYEHEEDIKADLAKRDLDLKSQGVKFLKPYYKETYNLKETDFELVEPVEPEPLDNNPDDPDKEKEKKFKEFAEILKSKFKDQSAVDSFLNLLSDEDLQNQAEFVEPIIKMIQKAKSFDEANEGLLKIFAQVRPEALEKDLGRTLFNTRSVGRGGNED